jgi:Protein of Unknown function (DUF2784)
MPYQLLVAAAVVAHVTFLMYLVVGGFLTWRHPRTLVLHAVVVAWAVGSVVVGYPCPLTAVEQWSRERAGLGPLPPGGFIRHYLTGTIYPQGCVVVVQVLVGLVVVMSWIGLAGVSGVRTRGRATAHAARGAPPSLPAARGRRPALRRGPPARGLRTTRSRDS